MLNRRNFLNYAATAVGTTALLSALDNPAYALFSKTIGANDQINIGVIGIKGMGWSDLKAALKVPGVNLIALCDSDANVLDERMAELKSMNVDAAKVTRYKDYRALLDNKDVDAVIIGTPDHWHALMMIHAVQAGKDVYVEKPVGNSIVECSTMVKAQEKYNKVVQAGQWQRSQQHFKDAVDFVKSGQLGNIRTVKVWCYQGWMKPAPVVPDTLPPAGVDYAMWLGPANKRAFNASRYHFNFRWFWDYAGGLMTDWGVHLLDYGLLGMNSPVPKTISALGGRFAYPDLYEETPDTLTTLYEFDKFNMVWDSAMGIDNGSYNRNHGIAYIGNNGTLILNRQGWEVIEEKVSGNKVSKPFVKSSDNGLDNHMVNFFSVVRSRKKEELNCSIQAAAHVATVAQMGNLAFRSGQKLSWDNAKHQFTDPKINDKYLLAPYHNGYSLPKV
ncbi:Gfo/Idh/MocA family oxidoreductase [Pedobacter sp. MR2016-19]|uniref:Gfo/Idh/MocA family protein n=1 Tax=Pedobacter sp. MR2016-19 TaxID=2780089 RepID=UPI001876FBE2|nr:Gfo/Idh/MocA family oxidoreductase [Pedobacter sp. MR2016-19]MBE5318731.1 Gfo/Idh/MocA family oxidoreductase [Pedobacter sp. MR2016-19]